MAEKKFYAIIFHFVKKLESEFRFPNMDFSQNPILISDFPKLLKAIKSFESWQHPIEELWAVYTERSAMDIYAHLAPYPGDSNFLFVTEMDVYNQQGWMPKSFWDWITNLKNGGK